MPCPSDRGGARTADLLVCGTPVEVKSWLGQDQRSKIPGTRSVVNKLMQAEGQAATVVLNGRGSGLSSAAAHKRDGDVRRPAATRRQRGRRAGPGRRLRSGLDASAPSRVIATSTGALPRAASGPAPPGRGSWGGRPPDPSLRCAKLPL